MTTTVSSIRYTVLSAEIIDLDERIAISEYKTALADAFEAAYPEANVTIDEVRNTTGAGPSPVVLATDEDGDEFPATMDEVRHIADIANRVLEEVSVATDRRHA